MLESNEQDVDLSTVPDKMQSFDVAGFGTLNGVTTQLCGGLIGRSLQTQFDMGRLLTRAQAVSMLQRAWQVRTCASSHVTPHAGEMERDAIHDIHDIRMLCYIMLC